MMRDVRRTAMSLALVVASGAVAWAKGPGTSTARVETQPIELIAADTVECLPRKGSRSRIYVEADGELLGQLPARIEVAAETLTLLIPPHAEP